MNLRCWSTSDCKYRWFVVALCTDGSRRGLSDWCKYSSWQISSKLRSRKGTQTDSGVSPARKPGKSIVENGQQAKQSQRSSFSFRKTANRKTPGVHWWLSHQRPVRVGLHYQTRWPSSIKTVQPMRYQTTSLAMEVEACSHTCTPLYYLRRWSTVTPWMPTSSQIKRACLKVEWEAETYMCRWSTSTFGNPCGCTARYMPEWSEYRRPSRQTGGQRNEHKWFASRKEVLRSLRLSARTKPRVYHSIDRLEERGVKRGSFRRSSLRGRERVILNQTNTGNVLKATSERGVERMWAFPSA